MSAVLRAEIWKLRRTLALWAALLAPFVVVFLQLMILLQRGKHLLGSGEGIWPSMLSAFGLWGILMAPLFVTLEATLLHGVEHQNRTWKHLHALPVSPARVYAAKSAVGLALVAIATVCLAALVVVAGFVLGRLTGLDPGPVPIADVLRRTGLLVLLSLFMTSLQLLISHHLAGYTAGLSAGIVATVVGFVLANSKTWALRWPWTLPTALFRDPGVVQGAVVTSILGALLVTALGCFLAQRREVAG